MPFVDGSFRAVLSVNVLHNLDRERCITALRKSSDLPLAELCTARCVHTEAEREIFRAGADPAVTFLKPQEWRELFTRLVQGRLLLDDPGSQSGVERLQRLRSCVSQSLIP